MMVGRSCCIWILETMLKFGPDRLEYEEEEEEEEGWDV